MRDQAEEGGRQEGAGQEGGPQEEVTLINQSLFSLKAFYDTSAIYYRIT